MLAVVVVGLLVSALAAGAVMILRAWAQSRVENTREIPPLFVQPSAIPGLEPIIGSPVQVVHPRPRPESNGKSASGSRFEETVVFDDGLVSERDFAPVGPSETVRFRRPGEEPVQILPGRLEVVAGEPKHREIRFVRAAGEPAELILGREPGRSPQSVTLQSDTVSRRHARFAYSNGRWAVANLSRTNPVVVNDERLADNSVERPLADGDRLELGEVVLRFRAR